MELTKKKIFGKMSAIPVKALDVVILLGILTMAILIPVLSVLGGFTVRFDTDGGSHVVEQKIKYGEKIAEPATPVRENYRFCGWYSDPEGNKSFDFDENINGSITVYAKWEKE